MQVEVAVGAEVLAGEELATGPGQQAYQPPVPYEDSPDYPANQPGPAVPPPPSPTAPQGFRARKLAELDQRYSDGDLTMEDYMAQRAEIMKG